MNYLSPTDTQEIISRAANSIWHSIQRANGHPDSHYLGTRYINNKSMHACKTNDGNVHYYPFGTNKQA